MTKTQMENRIREIDRNMEMIFFNIDWSKFKSNAKGKTLENAKTGYVGLCELLCKNNHTLLSEYTNNKAKIHIDFNCEHETHWITPNDYKNGIRCPKCAVELKAKMKKDKAKEDFLKLLESNSHVLLSEYVDNSTKVKIDFNCGHKPHWITPNNYKNGYGCPKCGGTSKEQAKEDFINLINKNGHVLLSDYTNNKAKVLIDFNCRHEPNWITPNSYKNGHRCPKCSNKCPEQAKEDLMNMLSKNNHELLSEYINNHTKILIDFNCGHEPHWMKPNSYKSGQGCPLCKNKGESELYELLLNMKYEVEAQKKYKDLKDKRLLPYDFYLPEYNLLIELDGEHHYKPKPYYSKDMTQQERNMAKLDAEIKFHDRQRKDKMKDDYAKNNNIPLLRIEYSDGKIELDKWRELILNKIKEIELIAL